MNDRNWSRLAAWISFWLIVAAVISVLAILAVDWWRRIVLSGP